MRQTFLNTVNLSHKYIIKHYKLFIDENEETAYMIMDYCPYPSLESILKERKKINEKDAKKIFKSLFEAIIHAHSKGICHRDIKPDNILVNTMYISIIIIIFKRLYSKAN